MSNFVLVPECGNIRAYLLHGRHRTPHLIMTHRCLCAAHPPRVTVPTPTNTRRVILVVLDGLRPDAVDNFDLHHLRRLSRIGASTMSARTVFPSLTWAALASLFTGVPPETHGVIADTVHLPRPRAKLEPLPERLTSAGFPSSAFMGEIPALYKGIASRIAKRLGFSEARFTGTGASDVLVSARSTLRSQRRGLIFLHWADADRAGHEHGWMSDAYGDGARRLDAALAALVGSTGVETDPHTLLIVLADHGGGGVDPKCHEAPHPVNQTIPLALVGGSVRQRALADSGLLDVPATIAWALGVGAPSSFAGRVLAEAFEPDEARGVLPDFTGTVERGEQATV